MRGSHCCDHSCDGHSLVNNELDMGILYSLYTKIDTERIECLNEAVENSGKLVFKPWEDRLNFEHFVESDCDEELLFKIPFTGNIKLKGLIIIGGEDDSHPSRIRLYKNKPNMSFDDVTAEADQEFELCRDTNGTLEYNIKIVKFSSVHHLTIHIPKNFGNDTTKVYYIGLRGEFTAAQREGIVLTSYELAPNPAECKTDIQDKVPHQIT